MHYGQFNQSIEEGNQAENTFECSIQKLGFIVEKSSKQQDIYDHIDYYITSPDGNVLSVDVKARKRSARNSNFTDDIWVELKNVRGNTGWLYGKQDLIAFDTSEHFIMVARADLSGYIEQVIDFNQPLVNSPRDAFHRLYQRSGRQDQITIIKKQELQNLPHTILPY